MPQQRARSRSEPDPQQSLQYILDQARRRGILLTDKSSDIVDLLARLRAQPTYWSSEPIINQDLSACDKKRQLWTDLVTLHGWLARDLVHASRRLAVLPPNTRIWIERHSAFAGSHVTLHAVLQFLCDELQRREPMGLRIALALIRGDTFQCYAQLLAEWPAGVPVEPVVLDALRACYGCGAGITALDEDAVELSGFVEFVHALNTSQLLEHAARVMLHIEEDVQSTPTAAQTIAGCNEVATSVLQRCLALLQFFQVRRALSGVHTTDISSVSVLGTPLPELLDAILEVRPVLSGPCLQFWLGRRLVVAQLRAMGGAGPSYGLPDPRALVAAPWAMGALADSGEDLQRRLLIASKVWNMIAIVPTRVPPVATEGGTAAAAAGAVPAGPSGPSWKADGLSYSEVHVYDMVQDALECALRGTAAGGGAPASMRLIRPAVLLMRLALRGLRPADARRRLPGLWRSLATLLGSIDAAEALETDQLYRPNIYTCVCYMGRLLRLELPQSQHQAGDTQAGDAGGAAAPPPGCSFSLRCALEAGLLPALERTLRRLAPLATPEACRLCLYVINCLLRYSGVWPAVLAHGSMREVALLIATLDKAAPAIDEMCIEYAFLADDEDMWLQLPRPAEGEQQGLGKSYLAALLEQAIAVLLPLQVSAGPAGGDNSNSESCQACSDDGSDFRSDTWPPQASAVNTSHRPVHAAAPTTSTALTDSRLYHNAALEPGFPVSYDWLVRAGGRPTPGSPAARQQRTLASLALASWLLSAYAAGAYGMLWAPSASAVSLTCFMILATQGLRAGLQEGAEPCDGTAAQWVAQTAGASREWTSPLWHIGLVERTASQLCWALCGGWEDGLAPALAFVAVFVAALPDDVPVVEHVCRGFIAHSVAAACNSNQHAMPEGVPSAAAASISIPRNFEEAASRMRSLLLQHGWGELLAVLEAVEPQLRDGTRCEAKEAGAHGCGGGSSSDGDGTSASGEGCRTEGPGPARGIHSLAEALAGLRSHCLASIEVARMPALLTPSAALRAARDVGASPCANPRCTNLEGPSDAALSGRKTCSRCRSVSYCSGACQLADWRERHAGECAGVAAGPS